MSGWLEDLHRGLGMTGILDHDFGKQFPVKTVFDFHPGAFDEHCKANLGRGLPHLKYEPWRKEALCVVGSGPSAADTLAETRQPIVTGNGGVRWLWEKHGIVPTACAVVDPRPHLADLVGIISRGVTYYIAVSCHPTLVDKLVRARANVVLWFPMGDAERFAGPDDLIVPGCTTVGLRLVDIGAILGYHSFDLHGMDSSFRRNGDAFQTHVHPDRADGGGDFITTIDGWPTARNFIQQIRDFFVRLPVWQADGLTIRVHGTGLLQHYLAHSEHAGILVKIRG